MNDHLSTPELIARYWRDISECVCNSTIPVGGCLRCDMEEILSRLGEERSAKRALTGSLPPVAVHPD